MRKVVLGLDVRLSVGATSGHLRPPQSVILAVTLTPWGVSVRNRPELTPKRVRGSAAETSPPSVRPRGNRVYRHCCVAEEILPNVTRFTAIRTRVRYRSPNEHTAIGPG